MAKACVFCGRQPPEVKLSNEHVLRSALRKYMFEPPTGRQEMHQRHIGEDGNLVDRSLSLPHGAFDIVVRRVCKPCNEGWLNRDVEIPAENALALLMQGQRVLFDLDVAARVSLWAVKTAMVRSLLDKGRQGFAESDFAHLFHTRLPPPNTYVWAAKIEYCWNAFHRHTRFAAAPLDTAGTAGHLTTFLLGHLGLYVLGATNSEDGLHMVEASREAIDAHDTLRIWPPGQTGYSPSVPMHLPLAVGLSQFMVGDQDLLENAERMFTVDHILKSNLF